MTPRTPPLSRQLARIACSFKMAKMPSDPSSRRVIAQMPLGGHVGVMARVAEQCRQGRNPVVQLDFVTGLALLVGRHERGHVPDPGKVVVEPLGSIERAGEQVALTPNWVKRPPAAHFSSLG